MKYILFYLLPLFAFSQADQNISVISAEKLNIVYRGIENPIKIAVPGAKSFKAFAKDSALVKTDSVGNYMLRAGSGNEMKIDIEAIMPDGSILHEEKSFKILGLPMLEAAIDGNVICRICSFELTKQQLIDAKLTVLFPELFYMEPAEAERFEIFIFNKHKTQHIKVEGSKMSAEAIAIIKKSKPGTEIMIHKIWGHIKGLENMWICKLPVIKGKIID
ncbi:hypothetical protein HYN59_11725 [Flavobacterium album]|uniref:Gliding motility-associated protein GldM second immunoglobulin-like domain-containing protein n=1 Tax=Flavobacterium album TaxID=2175091 RepID=A0A2S1QZD0_9FLAO|nr:GldM family protein [Flavobacterium album]AWH85735.1 hypothetical protein HYN59_11725 [Flavobacterium album]